MIIYKDLISGDEMFSDIYKMKLIDDMIYEVEGKIVTEGATDISDALIGGNASAEGVDADSAVEGAGKSGCNIVLANRLEEITLDKKGFKSRIQVYMKKILGKLTETDPERAAIFKAKAQAIVKNILENFKDWQFFVGESLEDDGMLAMLNYREDGMTPYMWFWKDGLEEMKV